MSRFPDRLIGSWTVNAAAWTAAVRGGRIESRRLATDAAIMGAVTALSPKRVLDLGCGEGWLCRALTGTGIDAVGIDVSMPLIEAARAAGGGRFERLPYAELATAGAMLGRFDAVVCNFSLLDEHIEPLLRDLQRLLVDDGLLLIQTVHPWVACGDEPYRDAWRLETFAGFGEQVFPEPMPWHFRTLASWLAVLDQAGYALADLREPGHPDTGLPLSLLLTARVRR